MKVVITGGAGFIGTNLVVSLLRHTDRQIVLYDNLSRADTEKNLAWLRGLGSPRLEVIEADIRDFQTLCKVVYDVDVIYHLAAQVAVTTSVRFPRTDFEVNAAGTINVLEAARLCSRPPIVIYASTNKVYGAMEDVATRQTYTRHEYVPPRMGISEGQPLDFHSPYGCSKGAADQYVRDYYRTYGLRTVVFRQSCIYGPWQRGTEDQGWITHFATQVKRGQKLIIYGDGRQVRDILYVDDLLQAFESAIENIETAQGQVYNIGGGPKSAVSLLELIKLLEVETGRESHYEFGDWRPGDQKIYVSDIGKAERELGWQPRVPMVEGIRRLLDWIGECK